jgi:hypothetical protein
MDEKNKGKVELYEGAKEQMEIIDAMLGIVRHKLAELRNEMKDCTPAEYDALERANKSVHKLYAEVIEALYSVRERKRRA